MVAKRTRILRIWHGRTPRARADAYSQFLLERAEPDYRSIPGNLEVRIARRDEGDISHFLTLTRWVDEAAVRAFAGEDVLAAKYYPEDREFLLEFEPQVVHYELVEPSSEPEAAPHPRSLQSTEGIVILALCGSLRQESTNLALLQAGARLAGTVTGRPPIRIEIFDGLAGLPQFNPDLAYDETGAVERFAAAVRSADGLLVSSPEYARGVPGALKNALDWLVGGDAFVAKPFALWSASPRAARAQEALAETLRTMSGQLVGAASVTLPLLGRNASAESLLADAEASRLLRGAIEAFAEVFGAD